MSNQKKVFCMMQKQYWEQWVSVGNMSAETLEGIKKLAPDAFRMNGNVPLVVLELRAIVEPSAPPIKITEYECT